MLTHHSAQNHSSDNFPSADEISSLAAKTEARESQSKLDPNFSAASATSALLNSKHLQECCQNRGLAQKWVKASCKSVDLQQATQLLGYTAKSPGILIESANGQYQFKPDRPWADKQGKKAPKYRTAAGDEYDALLPKHPTEVNYWTDIEKLKQRCYQINGHPMLLITEGGFKAIAACSHNIPTIALLGVEMGLTPAKDDPQQKRYLIPTLERLAKLGFGFILAFDCDTYSNKSVIQALIKLAFQLLKFQGTVYTLPKWNAEEGKGIDDYIQNNGIEEFRKKLLAQAIGFQDWHQQYGRDAFDSKPPKPDLIGAEIAEQYRDRWSYCDELKTWLAYSLETEGIWTVVSKQYLAAEVHTILKARGIVGYGTNAYIENIIGALQRELFTRKWNEKLSADWLPFRNGVLELATNQLHQHSPGFRFTWQLPRDYTVVETGWRQINNWLNEATRGNREHQRLLLCFAAAVLRGRNDLQKFLHLIGSGGAGKSTFTTLITALIGEENTITLNLPDLEDKHEVARIFGKRLVVLPDQDKAPKQLSNFKRLTGQDRLSGRRLFENGFEFVFGGLTIVTSNFPLFHTNLGSWLTRRVTMIPFDYQCPPHQKRDLMADFESELGAFTSYLLSISNAEIDAAFKQRDSRSLSPTVWESQVRSDGLAAWLNDWVIQDSTARVRIGSNSKEWLRDDDYNPSSSTLYGSYALYCQQTNRSAKSSQNFSAELLELVNRILGWSAKKARVKIAGQTVRVIEGLRLRSPNDEEPTIEEILEGNHQGDLRSEHRSDNEDNNEGDNRGDNQGDNGGDSLKPPPDKSGDNGDNLFLFLEKNKQNFFSSRNNPLTGTEPEEVDKKIPLNNSSEADIPVTIESQQGIEAVTSAVTEVVTSAVTPEINWKSYPYSSKDIYTLKNRANKVKERILACHTSNELIGILAAGQASEPEIEWLKENLFCDSERQQLEKIEATRQGNLFGTKETTPDCNKVKADIEAQIQKIAPSQEVTEVLSTQVDPFDSPESIADLASMLSQIENADNLAELLNIEGFTRDRFERAVRQLPSARQQQLRQWAMENQQHD